jgi:glycine/D-amino acid oxidase-like deaminating enzyme
MTHVDALVLGGGFFGAKVAVALKAMGLAHVVLLEPKPIGCGATAANQCRVHSGLHYCRHHATAAAAQRNYLRFLADHAPTIRGNDRHIYAIAEGSLTSPEQFEAHARAIGARIRLMDWRVNPGPCELFSIKMIQAAYEVDELSFDIDAMREFLGQQLKQARVEVVQRAGQIKDISDSAIDVWDCVETWRADYVFNCCYGNIDRVGVPIRTRLKKELTEVALVRPPLELIDTDITVMDGPFWSMMAYPSHSCHALTHVRYTPHYEWFPPSPMPIQPQCSYWKDMVADAARYVPLMEKCEYIDSMFTTRVVLADNEADDGRPVLYEHAEASPRIVSILGSKFAAIYDVLDRLQETMGPPAKTCIRVVGRRALIGRGFVGSNLDQPGRFTDRYHSKNVHEMRGHYQQIVIAAPSAEKWKANMQPGTDFDQVEAITLALKNCTADDVVLCSTIDVHGDTKYGLHRKQLETAVRILFPGVARIVRLPALYGPGLKKNALFDILRKESLPLSSEDEYQWYDVRRLWNDLRNVKPCATWDVVPAPVPMSWIAGKLGRFIPPSGIPVKYDYRTPDGGYTESEESVKAGLLKFIGEYKR